MSGEYLPPVVARITGDVDGLVAAVARAKAALDALKASSGNVKVGFDVSAASLARATVAADAMTAATTRTTAAGARWTGWLAVAHNVLTVFGANIIADTIGIIAFGIGAVGAFAPVVEVIKNLGQNYASLNPLQKAATVQLTNFANQFGRIANPGIYAVVTAGLTMIGTHLGHTGGIMDQAAIAFENFMAMLRTSFASGPWQAILGRSSGLIQKDLTALFGLLTALINVIPALVHNFNTLGLGVIGGATAILHLIAVVGNANPELLRFASIAFLVYRGLRLIGAFNAGSALRSSLIPALTSLAGSGGLVAKTLQSISTYGLGTTAFLLTGLTPAALGAAGGFLAAAAGVTALILWTNRYKNDSYTLAGALAAQDHAVGDNVAGYQKLASQLQANVNQGQQYVGASRQLAANLLAQSQAQQQAAQTAQTLSGNLGYLERTYNLTQQQAFQLARATGVNLQQAFFKGGGAAQATRLKIQAYEQTVNAARNPTSQLAYDFGLASNQALDMTKRIQALTNAFNSLLTPFANVITDTSTWRGDQAALEKAIDATNGKIGYGTNLQRAAASALGTSITDTVNLSNAILTQTRSMQKAAGPILQEMTYLEGLHSKSSIVAQAIRVLQQDLNALHSKSITITTNFVTTGNWAAGQPFQPGGAFSPHRHAAGTSNAPPGWSWVGEQGPELMYFRGGEQVVPHGQSVAMSNGAGRGTQVIEKQPIIIMLDGAPIYQAVKETVAYKNQQNGVRTPKGSVQGRFGTRT